VPFPYEALVVPMTAPNDVPRSTRGFIAIEQLAGSMTR
jgi:hypothetical protein